MNSNSTPASAALNSMARKTILDHITEAVHRELIAQSDLNECNSASPTLINGSSNNQHNNYTMNGDHKNNKMTTSSRSPSLTGSSDPNDGLRIEIQSDNEENDGPVDGSVSNGATRSDDQLPPPPAVISAGSEKLHSLLVSGVDSPAAGSLDMTMGSTMSTARFEPKSNCATNDSCCLNNTMTQVTNTEHATPPTPPTPPTPSKTTKRSIATNDHELSAQSSDNSNSPKMLKIDEDQT